MYRCHQFYPAEENTEVDQRFKLLSSKQIPLLYQQLHKLRHEEGRGALHAENDHIMPRDRIKPKDCLIPAILDEETLDGCLECGCVSKQKHGVVGEVGNSIRDKRCKLLGLQKQSIKLRIYRHLCDLIQQLLLNPRLKYWCVCVFER